MNTRLVGKIGDPVIGQIPIIYELDLSKFLTYINPKDYGLDVIGIQPLDYFITSGDAVQKTTVLDKDLWKHAGNIRKMLCEIIAQENNCQLNEAHKLLKDGIISTTYPKLSEYETLIWRSAGQSRKLLQALKDARGTNCFLETEWGDDRILYCLCKNPRNK